VVKLAEHCADADAAEAVFASAKKQAQALRQQNDIDDARATRFANWLAGLLGNDASQRAAPDVLRQGAGGPPTLWAKGISGDRPILMVALASENDLAVASDAMRAQLWWHQQRVAIDVVLLNRSGDALVGGIDPLVEAQQTALKADDALPKAEVFSLRDDAIDDALRAGLMTAAKVLLGERTTVALDERSGGAPTDVPPAVRASTPAARNTALRSHRRPKSRSSVPTTS
jgi:cyclic beta-1,2-glucan synthetase